MSTATATPQKVMLTPEQKKEALKKLKFTKSEAALLGILQNGGSEKTVAQIVKDYNKKTGSDSKEGSIKTSISKLRGMFKEVGVVFPKKWNPKDTGEGRGRQAERISIEDALNGLDFGSLELEAVSSDTDDDDSDNDSDDDSGESQE